MQSCGIKFKVGDRDPSKSRYLPCYCVGQPIDLSCLRKLQSLSFNYMVHPAVLSVLSKPVLSLKQISFQVALDTPRSIQFNKYKTLDTCLCDPAFQALEGVRVVYVGNLHLETVQERMERALPQVSKRDILRIVRKEESVRSVFYSTCISLIPSAAI